GARPPHPQPAWPVAFSVVPPGCSPAWSRLIRSETSASSCSKSRWYSSSRSRTFSRSYHPRPMPCRPEPGCRCRLLCTWSPPLCVSLEEAVDSLLCVTQGLGPLPEERTPLVGELVDPLARAGRFVVPLGTNEALVFEHTQEPVEVAHVDALSCYLGLLMQ